MSPVRSARGKLLFVEILVVMLVVIAGVLYLVFFLHRDDKANWETCASNIRQIATACQLYNQDHNGHFPGGSWVKEVQGYLGSGAPDAFYCRDDAENTAKNPVSYGYNALLVGPDGRGISERQIVSPTEVGVVCDAEPTTFYPTGGLIGANLQPGLVNMSPAPRHNHGLGVSYADGHAYWIAYKTVARRSKKQHIAYYSGSVPRAFSAVAPLQLIDNPTGGIGSFPIHTATNTPLTLGGEPCTASLLRAAAGVWRVQTKAPVSSKGFLGQYNTRGQGTNYLWGTGDDIKPDGPSIALARDAVVIIVSKRNRIPHLMYDKDHNAPVMDYATIRAIFTAGQHVNTFQAYTFNESSGTRRYLIDHLATGRTWQIGIKAKVVKNDLAMEDALNNDPYGIGYCSSAIVDPILFTVVGLLAPDGQTYFLPLDATGDRYIVPDKAGWPLLRTLYATYGGAAQSHAGTGIVDVLLAPNAPGAKTLHAGPLFQGSYQVP